MERRSLLHLVRKVRFAPLPYKTNDDGSVTSRTFGFFPGNHRGNLFNPESTGSTLRDEEGGEIQYIVGIKM
jgi:hypothetical protein